VEALAEDEYSMTFHSRLDFLISCMVMLLALQSYLATLTIQR
jgi:hypothetical protein